MTWKEKTRKGLGIYCVSLVNLTENDPPESDVQDTAAGIEESPVADGVKAAASVLRVDYAP